MDKRTIQIIGIIAAVLSIISAVLFIADWKKKKDTEVSSGGAGGSAGGGGKPSQKIDSDTPLVVGMQGATVTELQTLLNARGQKYQGASLVVDGDFGNKTKTVAENYLASRLMPVSPVTLNRIKSISI